jgi:hypothetical protein
MRRGKLRRKEADWKAVRRWNDSTEMDELKRLKRLV